VVPGGVGERLLHAAPCAVAIAPRDYTRPPTGLRRIGVGFVDGPEGAEALALAGALARRSGARVTTYTVVGDEPQGLAEILRKARAGVPAELLDDTAVLHGAAASELAAVSAGLDLLICGSRGYGPVRSLLLGGVTWELAHTARCPLFVVPRAPDP
jgi:nucleotide-binding universal stress UspA family protein